MTIWWLSWHRSIVGSNSVQYRPRCEKLILLDRQTNIWFFKRSRSKKRKNLKSEAYSLDSILTIATSQTTSAKSSRHFTTEFYVCTSKKVSDQNYFEIKEGLGTSREAQNEIPQIDVKFYYGALIDLEAYWGKPIQWNACIVMMRSRCVQPWHWTQCTYIHSSKWYIEIFEPKDTPLIMGEAFVLLGHLLSMRKWNLDSFSKERMWAWPIINSLC